MTTREPTAGRPGAHARRIRPSSRTGPAMPPPDPAAHSDPDPAVSKVAACALGLAYAQREDAEGLRELAGIAEGDEAVLGAARARLATVSVVDDETRERADALLYTAIGHLDRLTG